MIWMSGTDKLCTFFNDGWLKFTGRLLDEELGEGWASGIHPDDQKSCLASYAEAFDACREFRIEYRLRRHDGQYRWVDDCGVPRFAGDGSFQGYIGSAIDITDRKISEETLLEMSGRLITAHEEERIRIARELHDDLSQRMALLEIALEQFEQKMPRLSSSTKERLHNICGLAEEVSSDIHNLSHELHPAKLDSLGLVAAVEGFCREFSKQHGLHIEFVHRQVDKQFPKDVTLCIFRIVQEALRNVAKHSGTSEARVELSAHGDRIDLCVSDFGAGFDPASKRGTAGLGLVSMRERLRLVGGQLVVESQPSRGTRIRARIPLTATSAEFIRQDESKEAAV